MTIAYSPALPRIIVATTLALALVPSAASAGTTEDTNMVLTAHRISEGEGGFTGTLAPNGKFGWATALTGDVDGDGRRELAVGSYEDGDGVESSGIVWILSLAADGSVRKVQRIGQKSGSFRGPLMRGDAFGFSVGDAGDVDGNGTADLAVGAPRDNDAGSDAGAVWVLFFEKSGELLRSQKISPRHSWLRWLPRTIQGGFNGGVIAGDYFGASVAGIGDLNGDKIPDLAVGDRQTGRAEGRGALWILFLDEQGAVVRHQEISTGTGGLQGQIEPGDEFGFAVAPLGDLDGDGIVDIAVGARGDDDGGSDKGAVWILFLDEQGKVRREQKVSDTHGDFDGDIRIDDEFGISVAACDDLDGDTVPDLVVGARGDGDGGRGRGAIWLLFLERDGTVKGHRKISALHGGFPGTLEHNEWFGSSVTCLDDLDGNGINDIAVGAEGYSDYGAVWILLMGPL